MPRNRPDDYRHRPLPVALANFAGRIVPGAALASLEPQRLIAAAVERAGAEDFGPAGWRAGLERLCLALEDEAQLNLVGRLAARSHLVQLLHNRLELEAARSADPGVAEQPIVAPVFITGLPRTGSTLLHGLLAQDPAVRVPWSWEVMLPGNPPPGADERADAARIARTRAMLRWVHRLAPGFRKIHPVGAELAQECIAITAHDFASVEFRTTFQVPSYQRWLDDTPNAGALFKAEHRDAADTGTQFDDYPGASFRAEHRDAADAGTPFDDYQSAMRYHRRFAQHLQRHRDPARWVFKAPAHLYALDAIVAAYPDARFVFTMRDPVDVIASIASHGATLACAFSDAVDIAAIGRYWMRWWAEGYERAARFRRAHPGRFVDLHYDTLVADPIGATRELCERLSIAPGAQAQQRMRAFLAANAQDKHGRHRYRLERFGIARDEVQRLFAAA